MAGFRLVDLVKIFLPVLPEVEAPADSVSLDEKIIFAIASGIIFLASQLPIYGLVSNAYLQIEDPFTSFRPIFVLEKGTLLELGLLPIVTSAFIWQIAAGLKLVKVNLSYRYDRELFQTGQKLTSIVLAFLFGTGLVLSGYYDNVIQGYTPGDAKPYGFYALIAGQIIGWNFFLGLMIEIFDKGYGFGSGVLSFMALQAATNLIKDVFGLEIFVLPESEKRESYGALINFIKNFELKVSVVGSNFWQAITRRDLPNLNQFFITLAVILVTVALQNFRVELSIRSTKVRGMSNIYPVRLLYTGALPVVFAYAMLANFQVIGYFFTKAIIPFYPTAASIISTGLKYFQAPTSFTQAVLSPLRTIIFSVLIVVYSVWFSDLWARISGSAPKDISKQFKDQGVSLAGRRDVSVAKELSKVIPVASINGALALAALGLVSEILGGAGKGVAGIIGINAAFGVLEDFMLDYQQSGGASQLTNAFTGNM